ncbi:MAG TPA: ABC transporter permease subunit [Candidatus Korarchaeota archaeon]|nr:ABC transporter permease subunit [Candidatus Korarchaeota archaeon]
MLRDVIEIALRSILVSGLATLLATAWGIPLSLKLVTEDFRGRKFVLDAFRALVGVPTVVVGLALYFLLSKSGPLGGLRLLYTPLAISIGQAVLITPLLISFAYQALEREKKEVWELAMSLGAFDHQASSTLLKETAPKLLNASLIAFNRAIGELGVALMLGGNIKGFTRVMTTAIALEVSKGEFGLALSLGGLLLVISYSITALSRVIGGRG